MPVADPEFPRWERQPGELGQKLSFDKDFAENCMKMKPSHSKHPMVTPCSNSAIHNAASRRSAGGCNDPQGFFQLLAEQVWNVDHFNIFLKLTFCKIFGRNIR